MPFSLSELPTDRVVWIKCFHSDDLDRAVADALPDAPAVIVRRTALTGSPSATVDTILDEMEGLAGQFFPVWLPGAEGIATAAGAALTAVRAIAFAQAADTKGCTARYQATRRHSSSAVSTRRCTSKRRARLPASKAGTCRTFRA